MANHTGEFPNDRGPLDEQAQAILLANMRAGMPDWRIAAYEEDAQGAKRHELREDQY